MNRNYSSAKILLNNKFAKYNIEPSKNVEKGKVVVDDEIKYQFKNGVIINKPLNIYIENIYYKDELKLTISNTYTKSNIKRVVGVDKYDNNRYKIFINEEEYNSLYDKPSYQSSVFVKDDKNIEETIQALDSLNLNAKKVTDFRVNQGEMSKRIIRIIKVVVTIVLIIVLFFISYLIIRIILKSRNVYYTILRMLGATYKNVRKILDIELFINSSIAYCVLLSILMSIKNNLIKVEFLSKITQFIGIREIVLVYIILIVMSRLISMKFARKLFKNTTISQYNEEV